MGWRVCPPRSGRRRAELAGDAEGDALHKWEALRVRPFRQNVTT